MILITGGSGYLAGIISEYFSNMGFEIRIATRNRNSIQIKPSNNLDIVELDLEDQKSVDESCKGVNYIIHLASLNHSECTQNPLKAKSINVLGTQKIMSAAIKHRVQKIIYFSTMHIYGENLKGIVNEKTKPIPKNIYASTHLDAEHFISSNAEKNNIEYLILRLSNVVASPISPFTKCWHLLVHDLCLQLIKQKEINLRTTGDQIRDFIDSENLTKVIEIFIRNTNLNGTYNYGSGKTSNIRKVAEIIQNEYYKLYKLTPKISFGSQIEKKVEFTYDINKLEKEFSYKINFNFNRVIKALIIFCMSNFKE